MKRNALIVIVVGLILMMLTIATAQEPNYTIKKGDTLWGISQSKLSNPLLWKRIWKANPYIRNPHWIYPGDRLFIPSMLAGADADSITKGDGSLLKLVPKPLETEPVQVQKAYPLLSRQDVLMTGYITTDSAVVVGRIIGAAKGVTLLGLHDYFYFETDRDAPIGTLFYILAKPEAIYHPTSEKFLGNLHRVIGVAQVVKSDNASRRAQIIESFQEIRTDDVLGRFAPVESAIFLGQPRKPDISAGVIVKVIPMSGLGGNLDVVHIDKGAVDGLRFGDEIKLFSAQPPHASKGIIQIVGVMENSASAIVKQVNSEVLVGDIVKN
jgi:hypothetical protein